MYNDVLLVRKQHFHCLIFDLRLKGCTPYPNRTKDPAASESDRHQRVDGKNISIWSISIRLFLPRKDYKFIISVLFGPGRRRREGVQEHVHTHAHAHRVSTVACDLWTWFKTQFHCYTFLFLVLFMNVTRSWWFELTYGRMESRWAGIEPEGGGPSRVARTFSGVSWRVSQSPPCLRRNAGWSHRITWVTGFNPDPVWRVWAWKHVKLRYVVTNTYSYLNC